MPTYYSYVDPHGGSNSDGDRGGTDDGEEESDSESGGKVVADSEKATKYRIHDKVLISYTHQTFSSISSSSITEEADHPRKNKQKPPSPRPTPQFLLRKAHILEIRASSPSNIFLRVYWLDDDDDDDDDKAVNDKNVQPPRQSTDSIVMRPPVGNYIVRKGAGGVRIGKKQGKKDDDEEGEEEEEGKARTRMGGRMISRRSMGRGGEKNNFWEMGVVDALQVEGFA